MKRLRVVVAVAALIWSVPTALAEAPLVSPQYRVEESFIGGGGLVNEASPNYQAGETIGDLAVGESQSTNFQSQGGYTTTNDPALQFIVNTTSLNFGALSTGATATATATFSVIDYTSFGYNVIDVGTPPTNGSYIIRPMLSTAPSAVGTEQFGLNLRANTSPRVFGADPTGGFGVAGTGYNTPNQYKFIPGSIIATSPKTSGKTDFTVSYIVNVSSTTGGGSYNSTPYTGFQEYICTGTY